MKKTLNIVSLNIPYPANYGGVIDIFYRMKTLAELGVEIIFHTFEYGRPHAKELEQYCKEVHYYKRNTGWRTQCTYLPYIVYSRKNKELIARLQENNHPILFEGLHTCYYIDDSRLRNRLKLVRMHNIEHDYYQGLARNSAPCLQKLYFAFEALRLRFFERKLNHADCILSISTTDTSYFKSVYGTDKVKFLPAFHPNNQVCISDSYKRYVLYQGDLSSPENIRNAIFLIKEVAAKDLSIPWVIAGLNPVPEIYQAAQTVANVTVKDNLSHEEMTQLLQEALINILYTNQASGMKLKLLNAVYNSHYCVANAKMLAGSGLEKVCVICPDDADGVLQTIRQYINKDFPLTAKAQREELLMETTDNKENAKKLEELLS